MKLKLWLGIVILLVLSLAAGCAPSASPAAEPAAADGAAAATAAPVAEGEPKYGGTLTVAVPEILHLHVNSVNQIGINEISQLFYETLFDRNADNEIVPLLVKEVDISEDGLVHTWTLQEGVTFHDGTEFNADVVKWNLDHKIETQGPLYDFIPFESIEVVDPLTVQVTLTEPYVPMYNLLAIKTFSMYSPALYEEIGDEGLKSQAIGTGPFMIDQYTPNEVLVLKKYPDYWQDGLPYLDEVVFQVSRDANTRSASLEAGDIDVAAFLSIQDIDRLKSNPDMTVLDEPSTRHYYMSINTQNPPLDDVRVRQAMNYAIDREGIAQLVFLGYATPAEAVIVNQQVAGFTSPGGPVPYDVDMANQLLDEAGWTDSNGDGTRDKDGKELVLALRTRKDAVAGDIATVELVQGMLAEVGIGVEVEIIDTASFFAQLNQPIETTPYYDLINATWGTFTGDAEYVLRTYYACTAWAPVYYNYSRYCNEEVDAKINEANAAPTQAERDAIYAEVIQMARDDAPTLMLVDGASTIAARNYVKGLYLDPAQTIWPVKYAWLDK